MEEKHIFLMPDYYSDFLCKMGACRSACCVGWPVSLSLDDYFRLSTLDCGPDVRDMIDRGVRICLRPSADCYAQIVHRYDGDCALRMDDGRCVIQAKYGEDALADVCRLYPRGVRYNGEYEISCSNSCEAVIELLFSRDEPLGFIRRELSIGLPPIREGKILFNSMGHSNEMRMKFIGIMQDRRYDLPGRFMILKDVMTRAEAAMESADEAALLEAVNGVAEYDRNRSEAGPEDLRAGISTAEQLIALLDSGSDSIRRYGEMAMAYYKSKDNDYENYIAGRKSFESKFPRWEICFEHLLVNHMFFSEFPFQDRPDSFRDEFIALCVIYTFLRFLSIGWSAEHTGQEDLIDVYAAAFRLIGHTDFERRSVAIMNQIYKSCEPDVDRWLIL